ncbi:hypothetical protein A2943_02360 [Candidatus Adlerbacteria bacterium RIFCSPLOWO2_01_FULL_51_16]|uniref:DoxX family protein n=1 Tax=Candidatus Adlerbacteria bacterium RIFCSPLOWO2_01_FULL_51_16 TaxID=1797243 RepID=A0A1F4XGA1_9BACT|nr:MAG: hypothetical protein A2943_02360 [Candidatus Adlerbacteria bacterium RIFCSPLOWO2_01_FULL_51_16]
MVLDRLQNLLLRAGLAFSFLYPALNALFEPYTWLGYFPQFVRQAALSVGVPELVLLHLFGLVEVILALWILSGWRIFWPSSVACAMLVAIVIFNPSEFPVLFRDLSIAAAAGALALSTKKT